MLRSHKRISYYFAWMFVVFQQKRWACVSEVSDKNNSTSENFELEKEDQLKKNTAQKTAILRG